MSFLLLFMFGSLCLGQHTDDAEAVKSPREALQAIAPYYDFMDTNLKPWHLKVDYELNDEKDNSSAQGVFEYWWVSPNVYRSSWTSKNATHSEWHTADGKSFALTKGNPLSVYEYWLKSALLSPLPTPDDLDPAKSTLTEPNLGSGAQVRCISVTPSSVTQQDARALPFGLYAEYCINRRAPILLGYYRFGAMLIKCLSRTEVQGKSMPRTILMINGTRQVLSARVEPVNTISQAEPALTPPAEAAVIDNDIVRISSAAGARLVIEKTEPAETDPLKPSRKPDTVILDATIGADGGLRDARLDSAQTADEALSAFSSVAHWRFQPYRVDGRPVTAETQIEIDFAKSQGASATGVVVSASKSPSMAHSEK